jgi:glycosyltransferase involved in cell wall biosynthesis
MRFGTPAVVSAEVPSVHDLAQPGEPPARLVNPLQVDDIAAGLLAVVTDDAVRADLSARGKAYSLARTWREAAQAHIDLWGGLA